jgi:hypothetical protein
VRYKMETSFVSFYTTAQRVNGIRSGSGRTGHTSMSFMAISVVCVIFDADSRLPRTASFRFDSKSW